MAVLRIIGNCCNAFMLPSSDKFIFLVRLEGKNRLGEIALPLKAFQKIARWRIVSGIANEDNDIFAYNLTKELSCPSLREIRLSKIAA